MPVVDVISMCDCRLHCSLLEGAFRFDGTVEEDLTKPFESNGLWGRGHLEGRRGVLETP